MATALPFQNKDSDKSKDKGSIAYPDIHDIEAHLDRLSGEITALTRTLAEYGNGRFNEAADEASRLRGAAAEKTAAVAASARQSLMSAEGDLEEQIRTRPLAAIGIAAGVGFLAAFLSRR